MKRELLPEDYVPNLQEALVDPILLRNVAMLFSGTSRPSLASVLQMFSLAEAVVLFDRLIAEERWRVPSGLESADLSFLAPVNDALALADDITSFSIHFGIPSDAAFDYAVNYCSALEKRFSAYWTQLGATPYASGNEFWIEIADTLNVFNRAWTWKCNWVANPLWEMFFVFEERPSPLIPKELYDRLSTNIQKQIEQLQSMKYPALMYIPPIPALALQECKGDLSNFWPTIAELRKEFASTRRKYAAYQRSISNPGNRPLGELIQIRQDAILDVENELNRVAKKRTDGRVVLELWDAIAELDIEGKPGEITFSTGANIKSLLSLVLREIKSWAVRGRAHSLFNLYKKALSIHGYERLIQRNVGMKEEQLARQASILGQFAQDVGKALGQVPEDDWSTK